MLFPDSFANVYLHWFKPLFKDWIRLTGTLIGSNVLTTLLHFLLRGVVGIVSIYTSIPLMIFIQKSVQCLLSSVPPWMISGNSEDKKLAVASQSLTAKTLN